MKACTPTVFYDIRYNTEPRPFRVDNKTVHSGSGTIYFYLSFSPKPLFF
jgi:hypothetical protein